MSLNDLSYPFVLPATPIELPAEQTTREPLTGQSTTRPDRFGLVGKAILNFQIIGAMTLPEGWTETRQRYSSQGQRLFVEYGSAQNTEVAINFSVPSHSLDSPSRILLLQILQLSAPADIWMNSLAVARYFGAIENPSEFVLLSARSGVLCGKRALFLEGLQPHAHRNVYVVVIDSDCGGRFPFAITYHAPRNLYSTFLPDVLRSLDTVSWK